MAEAAFSLQQEEAENRDLVVQRQDMAAAGTETVGGYQRQIQADPIFYCAVICSCDEPEKAAADKEDFKKWKI